MHHSETTPDVTDAPAFSASLLVPVEDSNSVFEWAGVAPSVAAQWTVCFLPDHAR